MVVLIAEFNCTSNMNVTQVEISVVSRFYKHKTRPAQNSPSRDNTWTCETKGLSWLRQCYHKEQVRESCFVLREDKKKTTDKRWTVKENRDKITSVFVNYVGLTHNCTTGLQHVWTCLVAQPLSPCSRDTTHQFYFAEIPVHILKDSRWTARLH